MSGSATDPGDRSSAEIEREVEATRERLTGTLEELRDRASPGQLFEQAVDYFRTSGGADFTRNLGAQVRDNPLPLLLIGAGIGWLMLSDNSSRRTTASGYSGSYPALPAPPARERPMARIYGGTGGHAGSQYGSGMSDSGGPSMTERASGAVSGATARVGEAASGLRDSVAGAAGRAGDMASSAYESVSDAAGSAASGISSAAASAAESVSSAASSAAQRLSSVGQSAREGAEYLGDSAQEGLGWVMREQPLVLGAIGLALGAAVGALLPGTEAEDRLMGETRDDLAERATEMAQEGYERVKETAGEHLERVKAAAGDVYENTKDRLDRGGLSLSGAGQALGEAAREAREAVRDVAQEAAGKARDAMGSGDDAGARPAGSTEPPRQADTQPTRPVPSPTRPGPL